MNSENDQIFPVVAADVKKVCLVDQSKMDSLIACLQKSRDFLGLTQLEKLICRLVSDSETVVSIRRLIYWLHDWINEADIGLDIVKSDIWKNAEQDGVDENQFKQLLEKLSGPFDGISRQVKAIRVLGAAGSRLTDFSFICDLRPVYDHPERSEVEGLIPLTTLSLETQDASGQIQRVEAILSASDLHELMKEAKVAQGKLKQLEALAVKTELPIPDLLTRLENSEDQ